MIREPMPPESPPHTGRRAGPLVAATVVIINPISGTGGRPDAARQRVALATALVRRHDADAQVVVTQSAGHATTLAADAAAAGATLVAAWGGDGTMNEVASALAFTGVTMALIPSGSGNGLARELGVPLEPAGAFEVAFGGRERLIDCGELDGRLFFNVAGIGIDARVAHAFSEGGLVRRGLRRYVELSLRELFRFVPEEHTVVADGTTLRATPLLIAIANSRQYGHGALIAPDARLDDGRLDVVVVNHRSPFNALREVPLLFGGKVGRLRGVTMMPAAAVTISAPRPILFHVDGETHVGGTTVMAKVHPGALRVMANRDSRVANPKSRVVIHSTNR